MIFKIYELHISIKVIFITKNEFIFFENKLKKQYIVNKQLLFILLHITDASK